MDVGETDAAAARLHVSVLGPLHVKVDGRSVAVPGASRRAVLAVLALAAGRVVGTQTLVDVIWPDDPPETGRRPLHTLISRLRGNLGAAAPRLRRVGAGYVLTLEPDGLDASVARRVATEVRACLHADPHRARELATYAVGLWHGDALEEFAQIRPLAAAATGLTELYQTLRDDAVEAGTACGLPGVTAEAAEVVAAAPLRERSAMLLMCALAAEGRSAEAMAVAATHRRRLSDETGLDPSPALAALEQRIAGGAVTAPPSAGARELSAVSVPNPIDPAEVEPATLTGGLSRALPTPVRPTGPMIGRDEDRAELLRLLASHPVVTVTGPGGVGKSRLVFDVAPDLATEHDGRVAVIGLAAVTDPSRVPAAVASTLALRISGEIGSASVAEALAGQARVIVLDNCEHVVSACRDLVAELRRRGIAVLCTSRVSLHIPEEHVLRLQPLGLSGSAMDLSSLVQQPSVIALVQHARRRRRDFTLTDADVAPVIDLVRRLDGLPLALELAAAQLEALTLPALSQRLGRALDALSADTAAADARHRTLRATIEWSYRLLANSDRELLRSIAVFPGGVDLATAEALAAERVPTVDPLVVITRLVDASLMAAAEPTRSRYTLLHTVRTFLLDELDENERQTAERSFLQWAARTARQIGTDLQGEAEAAADRRLRDELPNLRAARDLARSRHDVDTRITITLALDEQAMWHSIDELWAWSLELANEPALASDPREAAVIGSAATASWAHGDPEATVRLAHRGLRLAELSAIGSPDERDAATVDARRRCWRALATVSLFGSQFTTSREQWMRAAADDPAPAASIAAAGLAALYAGDFEDADALLHQATALLDGNPRPSVVALIQYIRGESLAARDAAAAAAAYTSARSTARLCGATFIEGLAVVGLATLWTGAGDAAAAAAGYQFLLRYWYATGNRSMLWMTARNAAQLLIDHGRDRTAAMALAIGAATDSPADGRDQPPAEGLRRMAQTLTQRLGASTLAGLHHEALALGDEGVLTLLRSELDDLGALEGS